MTDKPEAPTERLESPPPPPAPGPKSTRFSNFRNDPMKVLVATAVFGIFGFGALAFTAGYWVGHSSDRGDHVIERLGGPGEVLRGPMGFRHGDIAVRPDLQEDSPTTTESAPTPLRPRNCRPGRLTTARYPWFVRDTRTRRWCTDGNLVHR